MLINHFRQSSILKLYMYTSSLRALWTIMKFDHSNYLKISQNKVKFQVVSKRSFSLNPSVGT